MNMKDLADRISVKDLTEAVQNLRMKDLTDNLPTREQIAEALGVATERSWASDLGMLAAGILVGAGLALLFAPKTGNELRQDLGNRVSGMREGLSQRDESSAGPRSARSA